MQCAHGSVDDVWRIAKAMAEAINDFRWHSFTEGVAAVVCSGFGVSMISCHHVYDNELIGSALMYPYLSIPVHMAYSIHNI